MSGLRTLPDGDWLGDHDERAWRQLLEARGGCSCCISPPCNNCTEPPTEDELNEVGFTYGSGAASKGGEA